MCRFPRGEAPGHLNQIRQAVLVEQAGGDRRAVAAGAVDGRGNKVSLQIRSLHIPRQLMFEAERILKSIGQNDTANNAINALRSLNMFPDGIKVNHFFTDPDAFFIRTDAPNGLTLFQRRELEFTKDNEFGTENALAKATERYSLQIGDWREWFGSAGA